MVSEIHYFNLYSWKCFSQSTHIISVVRNKQGRNEISESKLSVPVTSAWGHSHKERAPLFWFIVSTESANGQLFPPLWAMLKESITVEYNLWSNVANLTKSRVQESKGGTHALQFPSRVHHQWPDFLLWAFLCPKIQLPPGVSRLLDMAPTYGI